MSKFSVKKPFTIIVGVLLVILLGVISFTKMSTDLLPSIELPYVMVMTPYPGASPEKVEMSVTKPVEQVLATTSGVKNITSVSQDNSSMVILEFSESTSMDSAMLEISSSLDLISGSFDDMVGSPMLMTMNPDMLPIMIASIDVEGMDAMEISNYAETEVIPFFERIDGVASVTPTGLVENRIEIVLDQDKIDALNQILLDSIDSSLGDVNRELADAKKELEAGILELKSEGEKGMGELASGSAALDNAVANLNALIAEETTLNAEKMSFEMEKKALEGVVVAYNGLNAMLGQLSNLPAPPVDVPVLDDTTTETPDDSVTDAPVAPIIDTANDIPVILAIPASIDDLLLLDTATFDMVINMIKGMLAVADPAFDTSILTRESLTELQQGAVMANARIPEINTELTNISTRLATAAAMKPELQKALDGLTAGYSDLEKSKLLIGSELSSADAQLSIAKNELEKAEKAFESERDAALKSADIGGILTSDMISNILMAQNFSMPAGYLVDGEDKFTVKVGNAFESVTELENLSILTMDVDGLRDIKLSDIASVELENNIGESYAKINGNDGIIISLQKQSTYSTSDISKSVKKEIDVLEKANPDLSIVPLMDQGIYIDFVIDSVLSNLLLGGALAVIVLFLFLRNIASTIIIAFSIPISLMFAVVLMYFSGMTLNILSLSGLALGVGMLVDNSIVAIENIYRLISDGMSKHKAAILGAKQISGAIFASTLTTICVFLPIVFTEGLTKQLFTDIGLTIAFSLLASLVVALTLVPTLSSLMLSQKSIKQHKLFDKFTNFYSKTLKWALRKKAIVLLAVLALFIYTIFAVTNMGTSFMPESEGTQITGTLSMTDASTEELLDMSDTVIDLISDLEGIDTVGAMSSSSMMGGGGGKITAISYYILLDEDRSVSTYEIADNITATTNDLDCTLSLVTSEMDMSAMGGSGITINIKGKDFDTMGDIADNIKKELEGIDGVEQITIGNANAPEETLVVVDKFLAVQNGLTVAQVYSQISAALSTSNVATTISTDTEDISVIIMNPSSTELTKDNLGDYELKLESNGMPAPTDDEEPKETILLSEIATITQVEGRSSINRDNQSRILGLNTSIDPEYNIGLVGREIDDVVTSYELPDGYSVEMTGENETINEALLNLILMIGLAVVFIYMIMVAQFQSLLSPFIIMFTIPLAFTGGLLALQITGMDLSTLSMLGFLMLSGIVVNNGIVFIDYVNQLRIEGAEKRDALVKAGRDRMRPILMTAITTVLGLSTMALGIGEGSEMMQPMAVVTIGGLIYSTILTLYVVPILYDITSRKKPRSIDFDTD